jgi:hypothetical protein
VKARTKRRRVSAEDTVTYLEANGWSPWRYADRRCYVRMQWNPYDGYHYGDEVPSPREPGKALAKIIDRIAAIEGRSIEDVRTDIEALARQGSRRRT